MDVLAERLKLSTLLKGPLAWPLCWLVPATFRSSGCVHSHHTGEIQQNHISFPMASSLLCINAFLISSYPIALIAILQSPRLIRSHLQCCPAIPRFSALNFYTEVILMWTKAPSAFSRTSVSLIRPVKMGTDWQPLFYWLHFFTGDLTNSQPVPLAVKHINNSSDWLLKTYTASVISPITSPPPYRDPMRAWFPSYNIPVVQWRQNMAYCNIPWFSVMQHNIPWHMWTVQNLYIIHICKQNQM